MNCDDIKDKADAYHDHDLNLEESREFENHIRSCLECRVDMESTRKCIDIMRTIFSDKIPPTEIKKNVFETVSGRKKPPGA